MSSPASTSPRLVSLDQFRGYTVAGMFLVNFLAEYKGWVPKVLHHHHNYCSYADTIMPHFLFAVGFAMRLSFGRRVQEQGLVSGYWRMVRRILGLLLVSFAIYTEGRVAENWDQLVALGAWNAVFPFLKRHWLQTLGQIALTSLWILIVIRATAGVRVAFMVASGLAHVLLSWWFNYHWVNSDPAGIDGGPLGFLTWTIPAILGTLTCDAIIDAKGRPPLVRLVFLSALIMGLGYAFSCGTRLYDLSPAQLSQLKENRKTQDEEKNKIGGRIGELDKQISGHAAAVNKLNDQIADARRSQLKAQFDELLLRPENQGRPRNEAIELAERQSASQPPAGAVAKLTGELESLKRKDAGIAKLKNEIAPLRAELKGFRDVKFAADPVIPPREAWQGRSWKTLLAEPPFVPPPADDPRVDAAPLDMHRYWNYWMMTQRGGSLSYLTFAGGFSILVYVVFYVLGDMLGIRIGVFRTFGTNALAAYVLHGIIGTAVKTFIPGNAPGWYGFAGFCTSFCLIWLFVRTLERHKIFLRV